LVNQESSSHLIASLTIIAIKFTTAVIIIKSISDSGFLNQHY